MMEMQNLGSLAEMADKFDIQPVRVVVQTDEGEREESGWGLGFVIAGEFKPFLTLKGEFDNVGVFKNAFDTRYGQLKNESRDEAQRATSEVKKMYDLRPETDIKGDLSPGSFKGGF